MSTDSTADDPKIPKIEFPCIYPIKIIGVASETFQQRVIAVVERHSG
jgi:putative lipoic acid-binding regulatory protein